MNITISKKIISLTLVVMFFSFAPVFAAKDDTNTSKNSNTGFQNKSADQLRADFNNPGSGYNQNDPTTGAPRAIIVDENGGTYVPATLQNSQANPYNTNTAQGSYGINGGGAAGNFGVCIGSGALVNAVQGQIAKITGGLFDPRVPTGNAVIEGKESGTIAGISWDQMGWCMINSLIEAIGDATVNWINSGFQGNPVFVEDPEQFFADVADMQAGVFLNEVTNGLLCTPIQNWVRINLATSYNNSINYGPQCSFSAISGNLDQFMSGETFSWTDWLSYTQNPYNNPFGATIYSQIQLDQRIASALGTQSTILQWGNGFQSATNPNGKITSPGSVIQKQVNERLTSGQRRLEIADEFDEVVNALVNQLVKVAITEMTESSR